MSKTIEISRELAERLIRAIDESQPSPLYAELRALIAAEPVDANAHLPYRVESLSEFLSRDATPGVERQDPVARIAHDDEDAQAAFEALNPMPRHVTKFKGGYAATEFNAWDAHEFCKKWDGFNQCAKLYAEQPAPVAVVLGKIDDICERFELEGLHTHPTYKQFKKLFAELKLLNGAKP